MKTREVLVLDKLGILPGFLIEGWQQYQSEKAGKPIINPIRVIRQLVAVRKLLSLTCLIIPIMAWYRISQGAKNIGDIVGVTSIFIGLGLLGLFYAHMSAAAFVRHLTELKRFFGYCASDNFWGVFLEETEEKLRARAHKRLIFLAAATLCAEIEHGMDSDEAKSKKEEFVAAHRVCRSFHLSERQYNPYFDEAREYEYVKATRPKWHAGTGASDDEKVKSPGPTPERSSG